jgi:hypothetical protein
MSAEVALPIIPAPIIPPGFDGSTDLMASRRR